MHARLCQCEARQGRTARGSAGPSSCGWRATPTPATRRTSDELVRHYMPLARSAAARYGHTTESLDDLVRVASIGLLKAIERYAS